MPNNLKSVEANWVKHRHYYPDSIVTYKNLKTAEELVVNCNTQQGGVRMIFRYQSSSPLLQLCQDREIPVSESLAGNGVYLESDNRKILLAFIDAIDSVTKLSDKIKDDIVASFPRGLLNNEFTSTTGATAKWIKEGDFAKHCNYGGDLNRTVTYKNVKALKDEEEIFVGGYISSDKLKIIYRHKDKTVRRAIAARCQEQNIVIDANRNYIYNDVTLYSNNKTQLLDFLQVINSMRKIDVDIRQDFKKILGVELSCSDEVSIDIENPDSAINDENNCELFLGLLDSALELLIEQNQKKSDVDKVKEDKPPVEPTLTNEANLQEANLQVLSRTKFGLFKEAESTHVVDHRNEASSTQHSCDRGFGSIPK